MSEQSEKIFLSEKNLCDFEMPEKKDVISKKISEGSSGAVYKIYQISNPNKCLAIKKIKNEGDLSEIKKFDILKKLNHKNIIRYEICIEKDKIFSMEFCNFDLMLFFDSCIKTQKNYLNFFKNSFKKMIIDTLNGLDYLQKQEILHNDIKLDNIMVKLDDKNKIIFKIGDFGYIQKFEERYRMCGTPGYISPEKFCYYEFKKQIKDNKSDIWSAGIMFFAIYYYCNIINTQKDSNDYFTKLQEIQTDINNERLVYVSGNTFNIAEKIIDFIKENIKDEKYKNLLEGMLKIAPKNRKTARECLEQFEKDKNEQKGVCYPSM